MLAACSDSTGLTGNGASRVSLSITTRVSGTAAAAAPTLAAMQDTIGDGQNELIITRAEIVLREIELERISDDACDSLAVDDDGCEKFETGPILVDLPLNGNVEQVLTVEPDTGTYDEIEFDLHKVSNDDPEDAAFRTAYPDMVGKTIRVQGSYNGQPFTYENDIDEEQEYDLVPPLVVDEMTTSVNVTVLVDLDSWFRDLAGNVVNPQSANKGGANESLVNENIRRSFEAFEDDDRDGDDDEDDS
jgi:hypothetical protein